MEWEEALKKLPRKPGKDILSIHLFEPHGRASELDVWTLTLHKVVKW